MTMILVAASLALLLLFALAVLSRPDVVRAVVALPVVLVQLLLGISSIVAVVSTQILPRLVSFLDAWLIVGSALTAETLSGSLSPEKEDKEAARLLRARVRRAFGVAQREEPAPVVDLRKRDVETEGKAVS